MSNGLGYRPDIRDPRDRPIAMLLGDASTPPKRHTNEHLIPNCFHQGGIGSCVANMGAQMIRMAQIRHGAPLSIEIASRLHGYFVARAQHGDERLDVGTYIRLYFHALKTVGYCRESLWPYHESKFADQPALEAMQEAIDMVAQERFARYYRIFQTGYARVDAVKRAIANGHGVGFGSSVTTEFTNMGRGRKVFDVPGPGDVIAGGHAKVLAEYDDDDQRMSGPGSWGEDVHDDGWHHFTYDYVAYHSRDVWVCELAHKWIETLQSAA